MDVLSVQCSEPDRCSTAPDRILHLINSSILLSHWRPASPMWCYRLARQPGLAAALPPWSCTVTVYRSVMWSADFLISTSRTECPCTACLLTWENNAVRHLKNTNFCHKMLVRRQCGGTVGLRVATLRHETCWPPCSDDWPPHYWVVTALITPEKYQLAIAATLLLIFIIGEGEVGLKNVS